MFAFTVVLRSPQTPTLPFEPSKEVLLATRHQLWTIRQEAELSWGEHGCSWLHWGALAKEEPTTCVVLGLHCFLRCKTFQLICTSNAPGDAPRDDL